MMNRRDFVKTLALLMAASASVGHAMPEQIQAFERLFFANTPPGNGPFIALDEVWMSGLAGHSVPMRFDIYKQGQFALNLGTNLFGGVIRWAAAPTQVIIARLEDIAWRMELAEAASETDKGLELIDAWVRANINGHFSYLDQDAVRRTVPILKARSTLADPIVFEYTA